MCRCLLAMGAPGLHFYTLNQLHPTTDILTALGFLSVPPVETHTVHVNKSIPHTVRDHFVGEASVLEVRTVKDEDESGMGRCHVLQCCTSQIVSLFSLFSFSFPTLTAFSLSTLSYHPCTCTCTCTPQHNALPCTDSLAGTAAFGAANALKEGYRQRDGLMDDFTSLH